MGLITARLTCLLMSNSWHSSSPTECSACPVILIHSYIEQMAKQDDNWTFWSRFVFRDCLAYIGLFLALRSENWPLRMASIKSLATNFTAFDHPTCQQLIARHILDVSNMPRSLIQYFELITTWVFCVCPDLPCGL